MDNTYPDKYDVFKHIDKLKVGDTIEIYDFYDKGICRARIKRIYRIGSGLYFDLAITKEGESFFGKKYMEIVDRTLDYASMARSLVVDEEEV